MFVEGLEDKTPEIRAGACEALGKLEVSDWYCWLLHYTNTCTSNENCQLYSSTHYKVLSPVKAPNTINKKSGNFYGLFFFIQIRSVSHRQLLCIYVTY